MSDLDPNRLLGMEPLLQGHAPLTKPKMVEMEKRQAFLQGVEDDLLENSLTVLNDSLKFSEIDPGGAAPPPEGVEELGEKKAQARFRIAQASWMSAKEAPVGIKVAAQVATGILKARAAERQGPRELNVSFVQMTAPMPQFKKVVIDEK